jgi:hypothetical protein
MKTQPFHMDHSIIKMKSLTKDWNLKYDSRFVHHSGANSHRGHYDHRIDCCGASVVTASQQIPGCYKDSPVWKDKT